MMPQKHTIDRFHVRLNARQPVRVEALASQNPTSLHGHGFYEISLVIKGSASHVTAYGKEKIRRGSVLILAPGQVHAYKKCSDFGIINVYYLAEWFLADLRALRNIDFLVPLFFASNLYGHPPPARIPHLMLDESGIGRCIAELDEIRRLDKDTSVPLLYLEACFFKFLILLGQAYTRWREAPEPHRFRDEIQLSLERIEDTVATHQTFTVAGAAREAGLSPDHFTRLFRSATGMPPMDYFQRHRIHHVCRKLLNSTATITEIAHEFGYADATHLDRYFKRYQQMTPREYRRRYAAATPAGSSPET